MMYPLYSIFIDISVIFVLKPIANGIFTNINHCIIAKCANNLTFDISFLTNIYITIVIFDNAKDYFEKIKNLYRTLKLPNYELSRNELFKWVKSNNPQLKNAYLGAARNELFICYDLDWQVMDCPSSRTGY